MTDIPRKYLFSNKNQLLRYFRISSVLFETVSKFYFLSFVINQQIKGNNKIGLQPFYNFRSLEWKEAFDHRFKLKTHGQYFCISLPCHRIPTQVIHLYN